MDDFWVWFAIGVILLWGVAIAFLSARKIENRLKKLENKIKELEEEKRAQKCFEIGRAESEVKK